MGRSIAIGVLCLMPAVALGAPKVAVVVRGSGDASGAIERAERSARETLSGDRRVEIVGKPATGGATTGDPLAEVERLLGAADLASRSRSYEEAVKALDTALTEAEPNLPLFIERWGRERLVDAWIQLASAHFFATGDGQPARDALRHVFAMDSTLAYSPKRFPPATRKMVTEVKLFLDLLGRGAVRVETDPEGSEIFIDGLLVPGFTPFETEVAAGPHVLTVRQPGHEPATRRIEVDGQGTRATISLELVPTSGAGHAELDAALADLETGSLRARAHAEVAAKVAQERGAELLVALSVVPRGEQVAVVGLIFDVRTGKWMERVERSAEPGEIEPTARMVTHQLVARLGADGTWASEPERPKSERRPLARDEKWWIIGGTIGGVVLTALTVGLGVGIMERDRARDAASAVVLTVVR